MQLGQSKPTDPIRESKAGNFSFTLIHLKKEPLDYYTAVGRLE